MLPINFSYCCVVYRKHVIIKILCFGEKKKIKICYTYLNEKANIVLKNASMRKS